MQQKFLLHSPLIWFSGAFSLIVWPSAADGLCSVVVVAFVVMCDQSMTF